MSIAEARTYVNHFNADPHRWGFEDATADKPFFPEWFSRRADQLAYAQAFANVKLNEAVAAFLGWKNFVAPVAPQPSLKWSPAILAGDLDPVYLDEDQDETPYTFRHAGDLPF